MNILFSVAIRMKLIEARINQVQQKLVIMYDNVSFLMYALMHHTHTHTHTRHRSSLHRTFEVAQWQLLHDRLSSWQQSIQSVKSGLQSLKT